MRKSSKILSLLVVLAMLFSFNSVVALANNETLNLNLADMGNFYIKGDALPKTATLPDSDAEIELAYTCSDPNVIDVHGHVYHGTAFQYVTVSASGTYEGVTYKTPDQKLLVLPDSSLVKQGFFDGFDAYNAGTLIGAEQSNWKLSYVDATKHYVNIETDAAHGNYLNFGVSTTGSTGNPSLTRNGYTWPTSGKLLVGFKVKPNYTGDTTDNCLRLGHEIEMNQNNVQINGTYVQTSSLSKAWHDVWYEIEKNANGNWMLSLYIDGILKGEAKSVSPSSFAFIIFRSYEQSAMIDDVLVMEFSPKLNIADLGNSYVTGDKLPETFGFGDDVCDVTYTSSDTNVIANDGTVTHGAEMKLVTVTPTITIGGAAFACPSQKLMVTPLGAYERMFEDFEGFNVGELKANTTTNNWTVNAHASETQKAEILSDDTHHNYLKVSSTGASADGNIVIEHAYSKGPGTLLVGFKALAHYSESAGNGVRFGNLQMNTGNLNGSTVISTNAFSKDVWHDVWYEVDFNDSQSGGYMTTVYIDGTKVGSAYISDFNGIFIVSLYRLASQYGMIDDIYVASVEPSPYVITNVDQTNTTLTGFSVTAKKTEDEENKSNAFAALYDVNNKLLDVYKGDVNLSGTTSFTEINKSFTDAEKLKFFVFSMNSLKPMALVLERNIRKDMPTVHLIGDSIVCDYEETSTMRGWGQYLGTALNNTVLINNKAISGQRSDRFILQGHFDQMKKGKNFESGDILLIKFGNNDQGGNLPIDTYKHYLRTYVNDARSAGLYPALVTPGARNTWSDDGELVEYQNSELKLTLSNYVEAIIEVGQELDVPVLDVYSLTKEKYTQLGKDNCQKYFADTQHLSPEGAEMMAGLVVEAMKTATPSLYIVDNLK